MHPLYLCSTDMIIVFMYYYYRGLTLVAAIAKQIINISQMTLQNRNKGSGPSKMGQHPTFQTVFNYLFALLSIVPFFQPHPVLWRVLLHPFRLCSILNKIASRLCDELELNQSPLFDYQTSQSTVSIPIVYTFGEDGCACRKTIQEMRILKPN